MFELIQVWLQGNGIVQLFVPVFSAFTGWFFAYCVVEVMADIATKHGRNYLKREYCRDALSVGAAVFAGLVLLILVLAALELETWIRGHATVFITVLAVTFAICGWRALRGNGVPFNVLFAGVCVAVYLATWWWFLDKVGNPHPIAIVIQAWILIFFNPCSIYWVWRQYHPRRDRVAKPVTFTPFTPEEIRVGGIIAPQYLELIRLQLGHPSGRWHE